jgi:hypothetical protein
MFLALQLCTSGAFAQEAKDEAKPAASEEAKKAEEPAGEKKDEHKGDADHKGEGPEEGKGPKKIKVSVWVENVGKLDLGTGSFQVEVYVAMSCGAGATGDCTTGLDFANGKATGKEEVVEKGPNPKIVKIKAELNADIDLGEYPFDVQVLPIEIQSNEGDVDQVVFEYSAEGTGLDDKAKLPGWTLGQPEGKVETNTVGGSEKISVVSLEIPIKRPAPTAVKAFLPVIFMLFVATLALLVRVKNVTNRLGMGTAALLSTVTFHISSTASLPAVGYLTRVDKFMIATYSILFFNILGSVAMLYFEDRKNEAGVAKAFKLSTWLVPAWALVAYVLVLVVRI